jgi:hypothetical protein
MTRRALVHALLTALATLSFAVLVVACGSSAPKKTTASNPSTSSGATLLSTGKQLYSADGCEDCHSLNGTPDTGPTWKGLYGSRVTLTNGRTVTADTAYLTEHIVDPDAVTVRGFPGSVMAQAIRGDDLGDKPADVRALVALIKSLR